MGGNKQDIIIECSSIPAQPFKIGLFKHFAGTASRGTNPEYPEILMGVLNGNTCVYECLKFDIRSSFGKIHDNSPDDIANIYPNNFLEIPNSRKYFNRSSGKLRIDLAPIPGGFNRTSKNVTVVLYYPRETEVKM